MDELRQQGPLEERNWLGTALLVFVPLGVGQGAADVDHSEVVQAGGAGDSIQRPDQAVLAHRVPDEGGGWHG
jgi:hypothetical protein